MQITNQASLFLKLQFLFNIWRTNDDKVNHKKYIILN